jgi:DNA-binding SARP family transcriptional activator/predicted ATPase
VERFNSPSTLHIRLLGDFHITCANVSITGINADRLQALLAFLLLHADAPQSRQQVAVQLWAETTESQAKANLRRRLHELRQFLPNADDFLKIGTKTLQWNTQAPYICDVAEFEMAIVQAKQYEQSGDFSNARQAFEQAANLYTGDLLPTCYDDWIITRREQLQQQAIQSLHRLTTLRVEQKQIQAAIDAAQRLLRLDPLYETAYADLMRLHAQTGDRASALRVYHQCMTVLRDELGVDPSPATCKLYQQLLILEDPLSSVSSKPPDSDSTPFTADSHKPVVSIPPPSPVKWSAKWSASSNQSLFPLIGRELEWQTLQQWTTAAQTDTPSTLMLIQGEPGIGKTRLLEELVQQLWNTEGCVLWGRAFESEMLRPYGIWADAFRSIQADEFLSDLATLLLDSENSTAGTLDRGRLFDTAVQFIHQLGVDHAPVLIVLDDIQWLDEASVAFLHYAFRLLSKAPVWFVCAARKQELAENFSVYKFLQALHRERRIQVLEPMPLNQAHTAELTHHLGVEIDANQVFTDSGGNPLFVLEIARALQHEESSSANSERYASNLETLIQGRLFQLHEVARDLVPWAAALGRSFNPTTLAQVTDSPLPRLLTAIEQLEQHGIIRPGNILQGEIAYDFTHDIVRRVAYQQLSVPRRQLIHLHIARALSTLTVSDSALINDIAYHASLSGEHFLAASASLTAAERCLRVFAYIEASELAQQGIQHCQYLEASTRVRLHLGLLRAYVKAGVPKERIITLKAELQALIQEAAHLGLKDEEAIGLEALIVLNYDHGNLSEVQQHSLQAAEQGRSASPTTMAYMLAHTGSCLADIGRDIPRAEALLLEAQMLAERIGLETIDIPLGLGGIRWYQGQEEEARQLLKKGWKMAQSVQDHWRECTSLSNLVMLELSTGHLADAIDYCSELSYVTAQMSEGSEAPHAAALDAVTRYLLKEKNAEVALERSCLTLHQIDSPRMLATIQTLAAEFDLQQGNPKQAISRAEAALAAAQTVNNPSEIALAWTVLIQNVLALGQIDCAKDHFYSLTRKLRNDSLSVRAQQALNRVEQLLSLSKQDKTHPKPIAH